MYHGDDTKRSSTPPSKSILGNITHITMTPLSKLKLKQHMANRNDNNQHQNQHQHQHQNQNQHEVSTPASPVSNLNTRQARFNSVMRTPPASDAQNSSKPTRRFFDSPRNSMSRSYSASNLRISRTYDEAVSSSSAIADTSSSSSDEDEQDAVVAYNEKDRFKFQFSNFNSISSYNHNLHNHDSNRHHPTSSDMSTNSTPNTTITSTNPAYLNFNDSDGSVPASPNSFPMDETSSPRLTIFANLQSHTHNPSRSRSPIRNSSTINSPSSLLLKADSTGNAISNSTSNNSPNIFFKKIISKKNMTPKLKAFKRIATELQNEMSPLDDEFKHESMITTALKDEDDLISSTITSARISSKNNTSSSLSSSSSSSSPSFNLPNSLLARSINSYNYLNQDNLKKFEIINKANESWNHHIGVRRRSNSLTSTASESTGIIPATTNSNLKRKSMDDNDSIINGGYGGNKRRIVSIGSSSSVQNSPILGATSTTTSTTATATTTTTPTTTTVSNGSTSAPNNFLITPAIGPITTIASLNLNSSSSRRNSTKLLQSASDDLEMMSLH